MKLNQILIDTDKISYIGQPDRHIKHDIKAATTIHFFLVVLDGHALELKASSLEELLKMRETLVEELTQRKGDLPA